MNDSSAINVANNTNVVANAHELATRVTESLLGRLTGNADVHYKDLIRIKLNNAIEEAKQNAK